MIRLRRAHGVEVIGIKLKRTREGAETVEQVKTQRTRLHGARFDSLKHSRLGLKARAIHDSRKGIAAIDDEPVKDLETEKSKVYRRPKRDK